MIVSTQTRPARRTIGFEPEWFEFLAWLYAVGGMQAARRMSVAARPRSAQQSGCSAGDGHRGISTGFRV